MNPSHRRLYTALAWGSVYSAAHDAEVGGGAAALSMVAAEIGGGDGAGPLRAALVTHSERLLAYLSFNLDPEDDDNAMEGGILRWDYRLGGYLRGFGAEGEEAARSVFARAAERQAELETQATIGGLPDLGRWFAMWMDDPPRWLRLLGEVVWRVEVEPVVAREKRRMVAALPLELHRQVAGLRRHRVEDGALRSDGTTLVPLVPADLLAGLAGLQNLGGLLVGRVVDWFAVELFHRDLAGNASNQIEVSGGWSGWADLVSPGASKKTPDQLHDLADVLVRTTIDFNAPGAYGTMALLSGFVVKRGTAGRPSILRLELSPLFRPNLVHLLTGGERRLVPVVQLPPDAFDVLNPRLHPAADRLHRLAVATLVEGARSLLSHGGVEIPWARLAGEAGLGEEHLPSLLTSWGWWERVGASRWRLREGVGYDRVIAFLREGGELSRKGEARGKASAAKRRGKRR